jgi:Arc/MetJ-type ribon-helix-helix transcriptional regulator
MLRPRPSAMTREDVAEVVREALREELALLAEKVERLATPQAGNGTASPVEEVRARLRRRRGL